MTTKQMRWKCPQCDSGALAPSRPRRDDVRRYCLTCSAKTGRLVERSAPALDKKRQQAKQRSTDKQKIKRAKVTQAKTAHSGFDVIKEAERLWAILQKQETKSSRPVPTIKVVNRKRRGSSGYYDGHGVGLQLGTEMVDAWQTTAHELVHAIGYPGHGHDFYKCLKQLTEARWNTRVNSYNWTRAGYNCDWDLQAQLAERQVIKF